ncbi:period circadian protein homolog 3 [Liasis olivaceus]
MGQPDSDNNRAPLSEDIFAVSNQKINSAGEETAEVQGQIYQLLLQRTFQQVSRMKNLDQELYVETHSKARAPSGWLLTMSDTTNRGGLPTISCRHLRNGSPSLSYQQINCMYSVSRYLENCSISALKRKCDFSANISLSSSEDDEQAQLIQNEIQTLKGDFPSKPARSRSWKRKNNQSQFKEQNVLVSSDDSSGCKNGAHEKKTVAWKPSWLSQKTPSLAPLNKMSDGGGISEDCLPALDSTGGFSFLLLSLPLCETAPSTTASHSLEPPSIKEDAGISPPSKLIILPDLLSPSKWYF